MVPRNSSHPSIASAGENRLAQKGLTGVAVRQVVPVEAILPGGFLGYYGGP